MLEFLTLPLLVCTDVPLSPFRFFLLKLFLSLRFLNQDALITWSV